MDSKKFISLKEAYASIYEGKKEEDCVPKSEKGDHNCAKKVCHEEFGEGTCIFGEHAEPDRNGFVHHYDVQFEHGVEKGVPISEMKVLVQEAHGSHKKESVEVDSFDLIKEHLMEKGFADSENAAVAIMSNMSEEWRNSILEFSLPRSVTVIPPSGSKGDQQMYKAGGGDAAMREKGQTRAQVINQGRRNYVKQRGSAAREDIKNQSSGTQSRVDGKFPEFRVK